MFKTLKRIKDHRYLLSQLVRKEIKLRYKRSVLGVLWSLLHPLLMMIIFTIVFSRFPKLANMPVPYYVFFLTGYLPWIFFSVSISNSHTSIIVNASLVKQVYFPRELLPYASCLSNLIHFLLAYGMWLIYLVLFQGALTWTLLLLPVAILIQLVFLLGLALMLSALNVFFRDVSQILEVCLTFLFYLTPVFYTFDIFSGDDALLVKVLGFNPMAQLVMLYRGILLDGFQILPEMLWYPAVWAVGMYLVGSFYFARAGRTFAKEL